MTTINTDGMQVANLDDNQVKRLTDAEKEINKPGADEIYLLAVQRQ